MCSLDTIIIVLTSLAQNVDVMQSIFPSSWRQPFLKQRERSEYVTTSDSQSQPANKGRRERPSSNPLAHVSLSSTGGGTNASSLSATRDTASPWSFDARGRGSGGGGGRGGGAVGGGGRGGGMGGHQLEVVAEVHDYNNSPEVSFNSLETHERDGYGEDVI